MGPGFVSLGSLTGWVRAILIANIVISLAAFPAGLLLDYLYYDTNVSFEAIDVLTFALRMVRLGLFAVAIALVCAWTWRAWSNLHALGLPDLRFSPAWAVGSFFIPIVNLYDPFRAMRELYNRSMGEDAYQADAEVGDATAWWGCTIAATVVNLFLWYKDWFNTHQLVMIVGHWATEMAMDFMSVFLVAGSAFFLGRLVAKVARGQQALADGGAPGAELSLENGIRTLESRARLAIWSIWGFVGLAVASTLGEIAEGLGMIDAETTTDMVALLVLAGVYLTFSVVYIFSVVFIGRWIHRGHANLATADLYGLRYSPGWAVGWFFIPFANLFKPFGAMRELWNASFRSTESYSSGSPANLKLWWACFLIGNILGNISFRLELQGDPSTVRMSDWFGAASNVVLIGCALLLAQVIRQITAAQRDHLQPAVAFA